MSLNQHTNTGHGRRASADEEDSKSTRPPETRAPLIDHWAIDSDTLTTHTRLSTAHSVLSRVRMRPGSATASGATSRTAPEDSRLRRRLARAATRHAPGRRARPAAARRRVRAAG